MTRAPWPRAGPRPRKGGPRPAARSTVSGACTPRPPAHSLHTRQRRLKRTTPQRRSATSGPFPNRPPAQRAAAPRPLRPAPPGVLTSPDSESVQAPPRPESGGFRPEELASSALPCLGEKTTFPTIPWDALCACAAPPAPLPDRAGAGPPRQAEVEPLDCGRDVLQATEMEFVERRKRSALLAPAGAGGGGPGAAELAGPGLPSPPPPPLRPRVKVTHRRWRPGPGSRSRSADTRSAEPGAAPSPGFGGLLSTRPDKWRPASNAG